MLPTSWQSESEEMVWAWIEVTNAFLDVASCPFTHFVITL